MLKQATLEEGVRSIPGIGLFFALCYAFLFSLSGVFVKMLISIPPITIACYRMIFSFIFLLPIFAVKRPNILPEANKLLLILRSILSCGSSTLLFAAYRFVSFADATAISFTAPAITVVLERLILKEELGTFHCVAIFLSLSGVILITKPTFLFADRTLDIKMGTGLGLAAIAALAFSGSTIVLRKIKDVDLLTMFFYFFAVSVISLSALTTGLELWKCPSDFYEWSLVLGMSTVNLMCQFFLCTSLELESAGAVNLVASSEVLFTYIYEISMFSITSQIENYIGAALITGAVVTIALNRIYKSASVKNEKQNLIEKSPEKQKSTK